MSGQRSGSVCKEARPLSHRLVDAGKWFARFGLRKCLAVGQSTDLNAVPSDLQRALPCRSPACSTTDHPRCCDASFAMQLASSSSMRARIMKLCWR
jgi:hypothetical protein